MVQRPFGENKKVIKDPKFMQALAEAQKAKKGGVDAKKEEETAEQREQRETTMAAMENYQRLVTRLQDPKKHNYLDILEY